MTRGTGPCRGLGGVLAATLVAIAVMPIGASASHGRPASSRDQAPPRHLAARGAAERLYLPHAERRGADGLEPCTIAAACGGAEGWVLRCGGMGRIRDMLAMHAGGRAIADSVVAVGDGVATFDPETSIWRAQIGRDMSGLTGLYVTDAGSGWAVGERGRIVRYDAGGGCWAGPEPEGQLNGGVALEAVMTTEGGSEGWAVGRRLGGGQLLWMRRSSEMPHWVDASGWIPDLPPLSDLHLLRRDPEGAQHAWLVSPDASGVYVARLGGPDTVVVEDIVAVVAPDGGAARPLEVAMRAGPPDEGWLFGPAADAAASALLGWRHAGDGAWWPEARLPERGLVDLYFDGSDGAGRWWLGATPTERRTPVIQTTDRADGQGSWSAFDRRGPVIEIAGEDGSTAIASLGGGQVLYAWDGEVWRYEKAAESWTSVGRRHRLVGIAPSGPGGRAWLLAETGSGRTSGARILSLEAGGVRPADAGDRAAPGLPPLRAMHDDWAVGARGATLHLGRYGWRPMAPADAGIDLVDLAVTRGPRRQRVWAVGHDESGAGVVLARDGQLGDWRRIATVPGRRLLAVTALDDRAWAVGDGTACDCDPTACVCETDLPFARADGSGGERLVLRAVAAAPSAGAPAVWAAGDYYVVRRDDSGWSGTVRAVRLAGVPEGATITGLAAGAEDDLWALATCAPYVEEGRGVSIVARFDGSLSEPDAVAPTHEALAIGVPLRVLRVTSAPSGRTAWLAGDWTTVLTFAYPAGPAPAAVPPLSPDLRCVSSEPPP